MSRERGLALVSVLWGVAILSLIAAAMTSGALTSAHLQRNGWNAVRAGAIADMAVDQAILSLLDERAARQPRVDSTPSTLTLDGVPVRLSVQDERGKINLNFASKDLLQSLLVAAGLTSSDAGALADRIVARRPASGAAGSPLAFRAVEELRGLPGVSDALFASIAPALTVFGTNGAVDSNVAPREVLRALPDMNRDSIDRLLELRDEAHATPPDANAAASPLGAAGATFVVNADVRVLGAHIQRSAAVMFTGDPQQPYLIVAWR